MSTINSRTLAALPLALVLAACGGGDDSTTATSTALMSSTDDSAWSSAKSASGAAAADTAAVDAVAAAVLGGEMAAVSDAVANTKSANLLVTSTSDAKRNAAATATAQSALNACNAIRPFYWEVGTRVGAAVSGSVNASGKGTSYGASTAMPIASASKWLYGAYVVQKRGGSLNASDVNFLTFRSGYVGMGSSGCSGAATVDACLATGTNGAYYAAADGRFDYDGGHMQKHASLIGLGAADGRALQVALQGQLGTDVPLAFVHPQIAASAISTPAGYARVLRKMMSGELKIGALLGSSKVCTNPLTCGANEAIATPVPSTESWHYSIGHWVEDDPAVGDGAFSSAGALGFYPWIDATKTSYGIVARAQQEGTSQGYASARCGRLIRKAWKTGLAQ